MAGRDIKSILTGKAGKNIVMAAGVIILILLMFSLPNPFALAVIRIRSPGMMSV